MGKHSAQSEDWYSRNHQNIYDIAQSFQSGNVGSLTQSVNSAADKLHEIMNTLGQSVQKIFGTTGAAWLLRQDRRSAATSSKRLTRA